MSTLNISLPQRMRNYIEQETKAGGYSTVSEYVRALIREDQKQKAQERLQTLLLEGLQSGASEQMTQEDWADIRQEVRKRLKKDQGRHAG